MSDKAKDLTTGMSTQYEIDGETIVLKPITLGRMKAAMTAFSQTGKETFDMLLEHLEIVLKKDNPVVTLDWLNDHMTLPVAKQIVMDMRKINGLDNNDFLKGTQVDTPLPVEQRPLQETTPTR